MSRTIKITIGVRRYTRQEFIHDVCCVLSVIPTMFSFIRISLKDTILFMLLITFGIVGMLYTVGIPIVLLLAAMGKIQ